MAGPVSVEARLQADVLEAAGWLEWAASHQYDSRKSTGEGWPDLVLVHTRHGILYRELKSGPQPGLVRPDQRVWLSRLRSACGDADVWTPADWPDRIMRELRGERCGVRPFPWTLEEALRDRDVARARRKLAQRGRRMTRTD